METPPPAPPSEEVDEGPNKRDFYRNPYIIGGVIVLAIALIIGTSLINGASQGTGNGLLSGLEDVGAPPAEVDPADTFPKDVPVVEGTTLDQTMTGDSTGRTWKIAIQVPDKPSIGPIQRALEAKSFFMYAKDVINVIGTMGYFNNEAYEVVVHVPEVENGDGAWVVEYEARKGNHRSN